MLRKLMKRLDADRIGAAPLLASRSDSEWLRSLGVRSAETILSMQGPIISGHPRPHVMRVRLGDRLVYLKKAHQVNRGDRWKNAIAGFGFISSSFREAITLQQLHQLGFRVPRWLAVGETEDGRAFLMIEAIEKHASLRDFLEDPSWRRQAEFVPRLEALAQTVADLHSMGISNPDLTAKHILLGTEPRPVIIDWARGQFHRRISLRQRANDLAALHASIREEILSRETRWEFFLKYAGFAKLDDSAKLRLLRYISRRVRRIAKRSSFREQRLPKIRDSQNLYWEAGERLCLTDRGRELFVAESLWPLAYPELPPQPAEAREEIELRGGPKAVLWRRRTRLGVWARIDRAIRGHVYLSPECRRAADLLRDERLGHGRRLLAFGQWERRPYVIDSFLLYAQSSEDGDVLTKGDTN
jgi:tRNA A-37 threonylcarbamoyl transferase component Bud32